MDIRIMNRQNDNQIIIEPLEDYIIKVVSGEMPAKWNLDALMAQAVTARSYAYRAMTKGPRHSTEGADVCTPLNHVNVHCQAYSLEPHRKAKAAVWATNGQIITYNGEVCKAFYSARCGGHTLTCGVDIWKQKLPYLVGVECPCHAEKWGHGVGMCQYGAQQMAKSGYSYDEILRHYYRGVKIETI